MLFAFGSLRMLLIDNLFMRICFAAQSKIWFLSRSCANIQCIISSFYVRWEVRLFGWPLQTYSRKKALKWFFIHFDVSNFAFTLFSFPGDFCLQTHHYHICHLFLSAWQLDHRGVYLKQAHQTLPRNSVSATVETALLHSRFASASYELSQHIYSVWWIFFCIPNEYTVLNNFHIITFKYFPAIDRKKRHSH